MHMFKRLFPGALLALFLAFATQAFAGDTLQRVLDFKTLTVGMSADQPPFNAVSNTGSPMGFDVDLARALASAMKVKLELKAMPFGQLMGALEKGEIDMVISGMAITPQRTEVASFVGPYMMSGKSLLTKDTVVQEMEGGSTFNRNEFKLVALAGSTSETFVNDAAPNAQLIKVDHYDKGVAMLLKGEADGMIADMPVCVLAILRNPDAGLATLKEPLTVEPIGIAVNRNDAQFLNLVENYVDAYEKMGLLNKLRSKWFEDKGWVAQLP